MEGCGKACEYFAQKLAKITYHTSEDGTRIDDRIGLNLQEKDILSFKYQIEGYKSTLNDIVLGLAGL
jgi:hypothetical protein